MSCRLVVADAHWLIRRGLRAALHHVHGIEVVGEAADTREAVAKAVDLAPDIALLDVALPGDGGVAAVRMIKSVRRSQKVMLISDRPDAGPVREALRAGCDGFVRKQVPECELLEALASVQRGTVYLDAEVTRQMVLFDYGPARSTTGNPIARLSERELLVFRLIGSGHTNRSAGDEMHLSAKTVEKYRANLMRKLGLRNALELQLKALELGIVASAARAAHLSAGG